MATAADRYGAVAAAYRRKHAPARRLGPVEEAAIEGVVERLEALEGERSIEYFGPASFYRGVLVSATTRVWLTPPPPGFRRQRPSFRDAQRRARAFRADLDHWFHVRIETLLAMAVEHRIHGVHLDPDDIELKIVVGIERVHAEFKHADVFTLAEAAACTVAEYEAERRHWETEYTESERCGRPFPGDFADPYGSLVPVASTRESVSRRAAGRDYYAGLIDRSDCDLRGRRLPRSRERRGRRVGASSRTSGADPPPDGEADPPGRRLIARTRRRVYLGSRV
jgi:hypothetical protein